MAMKLKPNTSDLDARLTAAEEKVKALHDTKDGEITGLNTLIEQTTEQINGLAAEVGAIDSISPSDPEALSKMMDERLQAQHDMDDAKVKLTEAEKMLKTCQKDKSYLSQSDAINFNGDMARLYADYVDAYREALQPAIEMLTEAALETEKIRLRINALTKSAKRLCKGQTSFFGGSDLNTYRIKKWLDLLEEFGVKAADIYRQAQEN